MSTLDTPLATPDIAEAFRLERRRLAAFIRRQVADAAAAEDLLQDVFVAWLAAPAGPAVVHVRAWLYRIARNKVIDWWRRREEVLPPPEHEAMAVDADPARACDSDQFLEQFETALASLPRLQREVFIAHELDGRSFKDLAHEWGEPLGTLLSRKHEAKRRLRALLATADRPDVTPNPTGATT